MNTVDVDHQDLLISERPFQQLLQRSLRRHHALPTHTGLRYPDPVRQTRNDLLILAGGYSIEQDLQHARLHPRSVLHGRIRRNHHFFASSTSSTTQPWPLHRQFSFAQVHAAALLAVPQNLPILSHSLLARPRHLFGRGHQHRLNRDPAYAVDQLLHGHPGLLDQFHHGQQLLPVADQNISQLFFAGYTLLGNGVIPSCHGGSPFHKKGFATPILSRTGDEPPS